MNEDQALAHLAGLTPMPSPMSGRPAGHPPKGWEPGVVWHGTKGEVTTAALTSPLTAPPPGSGSVWDGLLAERGLDPAVFEVVGDTIRWCSYDGWRRDSPDGDAYTALCYSYKAEIRPRTAHAAAGADWEDLYVQARKAKPKQRAPRTGDATLVVCLSDWQTGNGDDGGVRGQAVALAALPGQIVDHLKRVRKAGRVVERVVIAGLGDLVEGTCNFYPNQTFTVEADRRTQVRMVRRALVDIVCAVADTTTEVHVTAVGGNHGENRGGSSGKAYTTDADNDDVAVFEQVAEIIAASSYTNITFALPGDELAIGVNVHGQLIGFTHGHIPKPQANAAEAIWAWWARQTMGRFYPHIADATIIVTGHFHHLNVKQQQGRTVLICPSLKDVGGWFGRNAGVRTAPGTLTFLVDDTGWSTLEVLPTVTAPVELPVELPVGSSG